MSVTQPLRSPGLRSASRPRSARPRRLQLSSAPLRSLPASLRSASPVPSGMSGDQLHNDSQVSPGGARRGAVRLFPSRWAPRKRFTSAPAGSGRTAALPSTAGGWQSAGHGRPDPLGLAAPGRCRWDGVGVPRGRGGVAGSFCFGPPRPVVRWLQHPPSPPTRGRVPHRAAAFSFGI